MRNLKKGISRPYIFICRIATAKTVRINYCDKSARVFDLEANLLRPSVREIGLGYLDQQPCQLDWESWKIGVVA